jgi:hypothetical protein
MKPSRHAQQALTQQRRSRKRRRLALLLVSTVGIPACAYLGLRAPPLLALANPELSEISGLALSRATDNLLWGLNDSGNPPLLYRIDPNGEDGGKVEVLDADGRAILNQDWEDLASLNWQGQATLLIGDFGDNLAWRQELQVHAVTDPGLDQGPARLLWTLRYRYPDGPRDVEGFAVDEAAGEIYLLSKRDRPPRLYRLPLPQSASAAAVVQTAEFVGTVPRIPKPTGLDLMDDPIYGWARDWVTAFNLSQDGRYAIVTTYKDAYRYWRATGQSWAQALQQKPERIDLPQFQQTEASALSLDGQRLWVASEKHSGFARIELPHR